MQRLLLLVLVFCLSGLVSPDPAQARGFSDETAALGNIAQADLPPEARYVLAAIRRGGPFPYAKDGVVFGNRERALPRQARGYYTEYTVRTPGTRGRGARRIVVGGVPAESRDLYYSDDHYQTFRRIRE
jgi:ribonuclease T1